MPVFSLAPICVNQGETSVESNTNAPEWNEQVSFIEQFPPLARRIKVQILDDANFGDVAVATHFLDLQQISNHNRNGAQNELRNTCVLRKEVLSFIVASIRITTIVSVL